MPLQHIDNLVLLAMNRWGWVHPWGWDAPHVALGVRARGVLFVAGRQAYRTAHLQQLNRPLHQTHRPPRAHTEALLHKLRERIPDLALRTTFISGGWGVGLGWHGRAGPAMSYPSGHPLVCAGITHTAALKPSTALGCRFPRRDP
jgi:hypothetical protein